jgi:hypothetical protein
VIDAAGTSRRVADQPGVLQHLQMLRDGRPADRQLARELTDRTWPVGKAFEDRPPGRIPEGGPSISSVSLHER